MARAILKFIRVSPITLDIIPAALFGVNCKDAIAYSALDSADAVITSARVDKGPVLKRFTPRARGSASPKHKPTAHIMIEVAASTKGDK